MSNKRKPKDIVDNYFLKVWSGPNGIGIKNGSTNKKNIERVVDETFHPDYTFTNQSGDVLSEGTTELKEMLHSIQSKLYDCKRTSFEVLREDENFVEFATTSTAIYKSDNRPYAQYAHIGYAFEENKVRKVTIYNHTQYIGRY